MAVVGGNDDQRVPVAGHCRRNIDRLGELDCLR